MFDKRHVQTDAGGQRIVVEVIARMVQRHLVVSTADPDTPTGESEFDVFEIGRRESTTVDPPRVATAKVAFECELYEWLDVGDSVLILGEIVHAHVDEDVLTDGKLDIEKLDTVGRLAGSQYASTADRFAFDRPD